jgi:hypothetical protein
LVTQQGFKLIGIGLIAGTVVALVCARFIEGVLYGVTAIDPISMGVRPARVENLSNVSY